MSAVSDRKAVARKSGPKLRAARAALRVPFETVNKDGLVIRLK